MVCDVQSTGMMRGIVREATVQLEPRGIRLCEISSRVLHANGPFQKEVEKIHIYWSCIVSYRDMGFENETRASGKLRGTIILEKNQKMVRQI